MQRTRRKQFNSINAPSLARWIVITTFLAVTGLIYVYLSLQLNHFGDQRKSLERELANVRRDNDVASGQIAALTSRAALQRRLKEGSLKMMPIAEQYIVRMNIAIDPSRDDAIQAVANKQASR